MFQLHVTISCLPIKKIEGTETVIYTHLCTYELNMQLKKDSQQIYTPQLNVIIRMYQLKAGLVNVYAHHTSVQSNKYS